MSRGIPVLSRETDRFELKYLLDEAASRSTIVLVSKAAGNHRAVHTHFNLLDDGGRVLDSRPITREVAEFIFRHFELRGDTESFNIHAADLETGALLPGRGRDVAPEDVRHRLTPAESSFTATGTKLAAHWPIFRKYKETGYGSIIRATLTNHQVCSSRCHFCSTISRNKRDSVTLEEAKAFVEALYFRQAEFNQARFPEYNEEYRRLTGHDIRLRGLVLSGGGQPNLWPPFAEFVEWLSTLDIDLGLITNGFPPKVPEEVYRHFQWIRISITPEDASPFYPDQRFDRQYLPATIRNNPDITVGYSYVVGPWTTDDILHRAHQAMAEHGFTYCRMLTDCNLARASQLKAHQELGERLFRLGYIDAAGAPKGRFFHQLKYHGTPGEAQELWDQGQCQLQTYNVFWDTTGHEENGYSWCYPCDSVTVLAEEASDGQISASERKFNPGKWGTVKNAEVERLFTDPVHPFFDPRELCTSCLFMRNNRTVKELVARSEFQSIQVDPNLEHVSFP